MRYFIGFVAVVILVVGVFMLVLKGFSGNGNDTKKKTEINLVDYSNSETVVKLVVDGPIVADENHRGYRITIGRDATTFEGYKGYDKSVFRAQTYANNTEAYANFLRALQLQDFTKGIDDPALADMRGVCPNGSRFEFIVETAGQNEQRYWSSTCGGGTFKGDSQTIRSLFSRQVPDFNKQTADIRL